ncbi:hypothetical protein HYPSUDRAFT_206440 [Hypholoma sublateritium FD-334 SS-4]|uniref:AAA+ ATPase domain-containing protein n=1 Tax=Hypholoma sublateritium (strain FD-334 SS-4) TaxID=945553 RepID=A0A0D2PA05_HYPSF|nr:hypothetical protein HYPSUDRAFT_206440 [Hypholoma sublateritium FD-334 SS-4]
MHTHIFPAHAPRRFASIATRRQSAPAVEEGSNALPSTALGTNGIPTLPVIRTSGVFRPPPSQSKGAAEGEYLQEDAEDDLGFVEDDTVVEAVVNDQPIRRYDWRKRAVSRSQNTVDPSALPKGYKRRVRKPPAEFISENELVLRPAVREYSEKFLRLLHMEEAQDEAALRDRLAQWGLERLQKEGYCLTGMGAYWLEANQFGRPVAAFSIGPGIVLPDNKFETGTQVLISRLDPLTESIHTGSVLSRSPTQLRICFPNHFQLDEGTWRLDLGRPNLIYDRMRMAISQLETDPVDTMKIVPSGASQIILEGTELRDVILRSFMPGAKAEKKGTEFVDLLDAQCAVSADSKFAFDGAFKDDQRIMSWARRYSQPNPIVVDGDPPLVGLNTSQKKAMAMMIGQRFSLIQGPPGTGKTKTIIDTVKLLKVHFEVPQPLLLCTYTNVAVDNLVDGLVKAGVKPLRVGYHGTIRSSLIPYSLDYKLQHHPLTATVQKLVDESATTQEGIEELTGKYKDLEKKVQDAVARTPRRDTVQRLSNMREALVKLKTRAKYLKSRIFSIQQKMLTDIVSDADVVCTTCITSACYALNIMDFPVVFIDEASMSTEPASLIPLMKGSEHVALIGDHKQLPPVIVSHQAKEDGFGVSLFERLIEEDHVPSVMLDIQYRMHPDISRFPAKEFYDLSLFDGTVDASGNALPGLEPVHSKHTGNHPLEKARPSVVFLDHSGNESYQARSLLNITEAHIVASVVEDLLLNNPTLMGEDIGIIAPYAAQIRLLTRYLSPAHAAYRARFEAVLGSARAREVPRIEVKTVDGFEGREKQVIVFSTVRNNAAGHIGFLADKKRLNVGLTRAKRGLFVVGSVATLREGRLRMAQTAVGREKEGKAHVGGGGGGGGGKGAWGVGAESWRRYMDYLTEGDLVVPLAGDALDRALYEHLEAARARERAVAEAERGAERVALREARGAVGRAVKIAG